MLDASNKNQTLAKIFDKPIYSLRFKNLLILLKRMITNFCFYVNFFQTLFVGLSGVEPETSKLSVWRSNQLSYKPLTNILTISSSGRKVKNIFSRITAGLET